MTSRTKISVCAYCEARVILDITAGSRHELVCRACGAPLQNAELLEPAAVKAAPVNSTARTTPSVPPPQPAFSTPERAERSKQPSKSGSKYKSKDKSDRKRRKRKKKRGLVYWIKEAIDEIEDLFD